MIRVTEILAKPVISIFDAKIIGTIGNIFFDSGYKKGVCLSLFTDDDNEPEQKFVALSQIVSLDGDAAVIKSSDSVTYQWNTLPQPQGYPHVQNQTQGYDQTHAQAYDQSHDQSKHQSQSQPQTHTHAHVRSADGRFSDNPINTPAYTMGGKFLGIIRDVVLDGAKVVAFLIGEESVEMAANKLLSHSGNILIFNETGKPIKPPPRKKIPTPKTTPPQRIQIHYNTTTTENPSSTINPNKKEKQLPENEIAENELLENEQVENQQAEKELTENQQAENELLENELTENEMVENEEAEIETEATIDSKPEAEATRKVKAEIFPQPTTEPRTATNEPKTATTDPRTTATQPKAEIFPQVSHEQGGEVSERIAQVLNGETRRESFAQGNLEGIEVPKLIPQSATVVSRFAASSDGVDNKFDFLLGKVLERDIQSDQGKLLIRANTIITPEVITLCKEESRLVQLALHSKTPK